jgi:hypothetical protein
MELDLKLVESSFPIKGISVRGIRSFVSAYFDRLVDRSTSDVKEQLYRNCLAELSKTNEPDSPVGSLTIKMHSYGYRREHSREQEAENMFRVCLRDWETHYEATHERHSNMLFCFGSFASFMVQQGNMPDAETYCHKAFVGRLETLGSLHPLTLRSMHNLTAILG